MTDFTPRFMSETTETSHDDEGLGDDTHHDTESFALPHLIFIIFTLFAAVVARYLLETVSTRYYKPPFTVIMGIVGLLCGLINKYNVTDGLWHKSVRYWGNLHPQFILFILLPPLLFESAFSMKWHVFRRNASSALVLAGPGVVLSTALTGVAANYLYAFTDGWSFNAAFLTGSILSATDPVAVVAVLHTLGAPDKLSHLIEGESLLNDGTAYVVFAIFKEFAGGVDLSAGDIFLQFLQLSLGGPLWGLAMAVAAGCAMQLPAAHGDPLIEISCLVCGVYTTFFVAEHHLHVSGVLAVVAFGVYLGKEREIVVGRTTEKRNHEFWEMVGFLANSFIFVLSGLVIYNKMYDMPTSHRGEAVWSLIAMYLVLHLVRGVIVYGMRAAGLRRMGYGINLNEAHVMVYSGLRGAVGLALAMEVEHDHRIEASVQDTIMLQVGGIVALTLLVNGTTAGVFYEYLNPYPEVPYRESLTVRALIQLDIEVHGSTSRHLKGAAQKNKPPLPPVSAPSSSSSSSSSSASKGREGLLHHLAESPFHGFADWPTVRRILPDVARVTRVGHVLVLDRDHPDVDAASVIPALESLEVCSTDTVLAEANSKEQRVTAAKSKAGKTLLGSHSPWGVTGVGARVQHLKDEMKNRRSNRKVHVHSLEPVHFGQQHSEDHDPHQSELKKWIAQQKNVVQGHLRRHTSSISSSRSFSSRSSSPPTSQRKGQHLLPDGELANLVSPFTSPASPLVSLKEAPSLVPVKTSAETSSSNEMTAQGSAAADDAKAPIALPPLVVPPSKEPAMRLLSLESAEESAPAAEETKHQQQQQQQHNHHHHPLAHVFDSMEDDEAEAKAEDAFGDVEGGLSDEGGGRSSTRSGSGFLSITRNNHAEDSSAVSESSRKELNEIAELQADLKHTMTDLMNDERRSMGDAPVFVPAMSPQNNMSFQESALLAEGEAHVMQAEASHLYRASVDGSLDAKVAGVKHFEKAQVEWAEKAAIGGLFGNIKHEVKVTVWEVVLKAMEMRMATMYEHRTISGAAFQRLAECINLAVDSLPLHEDLGDAAGAAAPGDDSCRETGEEEPLTKAAAAASAASAATTTAASAVAPEGDTAAAAAAADTPVPRHRRSSIGSTAGSMANIESGGEVRRRRPSVPFVDEIPVEGGTSRKPGGLAAAAAAAAATTAAAPVPSKGLRRSFDFAGPRILGTSTRPVNVRASHMWSKVRKFVVEDSDLSTGDNGSFSAGPGKKKLRANSPFQVAWNMLEHKVDQDLDTSLRHAKHKGLYRWLRALSPHRSEHGLTTSVQALMGFIAAVEKTSRSIVSIEFENIFAEDPEEILRQLAQETEDNTQSDSEDHINGTFHSSRSWRRYSMKASTSLTGAGRRKSELLTVPRHLVGEGAPARLPIVSWVLKQLKVVKLQAYGTLAAMRLMFPAELRVIHTMLAADIALSYVRNKVVLLCDQGMLTHHTLEDILEVIKRRHERMQSYNLRYL